MSDKRSVAVTVTLLAAIVAIFGVSLWLNRGAPEETSFVGTDSAATAHIETVEPDYTPWFAPVFSAGSAEIESGLFALQAAIGSGVLCFAVGALWQRHRSSMTNPTGVASRGAAADE
ncbi:energy-coupling factor ABC transporter substrate-binding protein [Rhodococcus qingshengii]|uniref:energy-coupling factor ABC transporter substrate-binding protein n=1 Tax=Rhodococcus qingshengii TaxID=334542 RepID=UPI001C5D8741|nr:energy-coupling factor ABC transporter substrate-binding protein [Rhodococcus qingshengii]MBW4818789.1 energy-coupling factor ABC transporter substrate-binding protein [Rhodococcus qingshengii]